MSNLFEIQQAVRAAGVAGIVEEWQAVEGVKYLTKGTLSLGTESPYPRYARACRDALTMLMVLAAGNRPAVEGHRQGRIEGGPQSRGV